MPRSTQVPTVPISVSDTGLSPAVVWLSSQLLLPNHGSRMWVLQPRLVETNRFGLIPFRSPLLWESRLISFPLGTEMFHFPRSAPKKVLGLLPVGFPIQTSTDHRIFSSSPRLIAAYHVFHRLQRQGIRPLLLITCFSRKKPLFFPCSIVNDRVAFPATAGLKSGSKPSLQMSSLRLQPTYENMSWWRRRESNPRPSACKADALPAELRPR